MAHRIIHWLLKRPMTADDMHRMLASSLNDLSILGSSNSDYVDYFTKNSFVNGDTYHDQLKKEVRDNFELIASKKTFVEQKKQIMLLSSYYTQDIVSWDIFFKYKETARDVIREYRVLWKDEIPSAERLAYLALFANVVLAINKTLSACVYRIDSSFDDLKTYQDVSVGMLEDHLTKKEKFINLSQSIDSETISDWENYLSVEKECELGWLEELRMDICNQMPITTRINQLRDHFSQKRDLMKEILYRFV